MPEAAEIRVISEYLNKVWSGKLIVSLGWDSRSKFNKTGIKNMDLVKVPCKVIRVFPHGKLIIIETINSLNNTIFMISQLGMEGKWVHKPEKHSNFRLYFGNLSQDKTEYIVEDTWWYDDSRHFGHFNVYPDLSEPKKVHGPCLMNTALYHQGLVIPNSHQNIIDLNLFTTKIRNPRISSKYICDFLMEQKHMAGIGNYLRAEILYRAKINPLKKLESFLDGDIEKLYKSILEQMVIAYGAKGLTIKSYWDPEGNKGKCPLSVYGQTFDPHSNPVEKFKDKSGRTVHWVPAIQVCR